MIRARWIFCAFILFFAFSLQAGDRQAGERCIADTECAFQFQCKENVCVKKQEFDYGGSGKSGKSCNIDADCIGAGKCVNGGFGKKVCSGN